MKTHWLICLLLWWLGPGGLSVVAAPNPSPASAPTSPIQQLTAAQVHSEAMQRLGPDSVWRYQPGQPPGWASPATDDSAWLLASASFPFGSGPPGWQGTGCFRVRFRLDSALLDQPLGLRIAQEGAMEVYLDGRRLGSFSTVGTSTQTTRSYWAAGRILPFMLHDTGPHLLAIRYARFNVWSPPHGGFAVWAGPAATLIADEVLATRVKGLNLVSISAFCILALLHFFLFAFYRSQRTNLYYSLYMATISLSGTMVYLRANVEDMQVRWWAHVCFHVGASLGLVLMLMFTYSVCRVRMPRLWLTLLGLIGVGITVTLMLRPD